MLETKLREQSRKLGIFLSLGLKCKREENAAKQERKVTLQDQTKRKLIVLWQHGTPPSPPLPSDILRVPPQLEDQTRNQRTWVPGGAVSPYHQAETRSDT